MNRWILGLLIGLRSVAMLHAQPNPRQRRRPSRRGPRSGFNVDQLEIQSRIDIGYAEGGRARRGPELPQRHTSAGSQRMG